MKKIIITLIALTLLTSCGNKDKSVETISGTTDTETKQGIDNNNDSQIENTENSQINEKDGTSDTSTDIETGTTQGKNKIVTGKAQGKTDNKTINKKETPVKVNTDDEALETEVNDLLDEFINSLDSYDK